MAKASSIKGTANLWRTGKDGAGSVKRQKGDNGGGDKFQETSRLKTQFRSGSKVGGGGMNEHASLDNHGVFANSTAGLAVDDKPFMPNPGKGRSGLDMYSNRVSGEFGMDMAKEGPKKRDNINEVD
jgi:hypothetical protein